MFASGALGGARADPAEAVRWFRLAVAQGHAGAHCMLCDSVCCMGCGAARKLKTCRKCKVARFCGPECVRRARAEHKPHCKRLEAEAAEGP
jgi:TPR repeat protein